MLRGSDDIQNVKNNLQALMSNEQNVPLKISPEIIAC
jgi:hypothetical protein